MRASTYTPGWVIVSAPGPRRVSAATVERRSKTSLTCNSHVETLRSCVHRARSIHDKKLPLVYALLTHSWELIQPGLCLPSLFKQRPLGFSHLLLPFSFQLVLDHAPQHTTADPETHLRILTGASIKRSDLDHSISVYQNSGHVLLNNQVA
jgi:hypothetical protein